jgi:dTDP-4-dehydrorhamnose 3,5-epimerase
MIYLPMAIPDVIQIKPKVFNDSRGYFFESWNAGDFAAAGINADFVQDSYSGSVGGVLRGLHYQIQQPQGKLIRVIAGEIFDVVVDIRKSSPYFGQHIYVRLTADSHDMLWVPTGFAHGFYVLSEYAEILYKQTTFYAPQFERTLLWNDRDLAIAWPFRGTPILSEKDLFGVPLCQAEVFL